MAAQSAVHKLNRAAPESLLKHVISFKGCKHPGFEKCSDKISVLTAMRSGGAEARSTFTRGSRHAMRPWRRGIQWRRPTIPMIEGLRVFEQKIEYFSQQIEHYSLQTRARGLEERRTQPTSKNRVTCIMGNKQLRDGFKA